MPNKCSESDSLRRRFAPPRSPLKLFVNSAGLRIALWQCDLDPKQKYTTDRYQRELTPIRIRTGEMVPPSQLYEMELVTAYYSPTLVALYADRTWQIWFLCGSA